MFELIVLRKALVFIKYHMQVMNIIIKYDLFTAFSTRSQARKWLRAKNSCAIIRQVSRTPADFGGYLRADPTERDAGRKNRRSFHVHISMKQLLRSAYISATKPLEPEDALYIFTERNGIYIIDLQKTVKKIDAYNFVREISQNGGPSFPGTKK